MRPVERCGPLRACGGGYTWERDETLQLVRNVSGFLIAPLRVRLTAFDGIPACPIGRP